MFFLLSPSVLFYRKIAYVYLLCTYFLLSPYGALFSQLNLSQFVRGKTHIHIRMITIVLKMESMVNMLGALEDETSQLSRVTTEATQICQPQVFCLVSTGRVHAIYWWYLCSYTWIWNPLAGSLQSGGLFRSIWILGILVDWILSKHPFDSILINPNNLHLHGVRGSFDPCPMDMGLLLGFKKITLVIIVVEKGCSSWNSEYVHVFS